MKFNLSLRSVAPVLATSIFVLASCGTSTETTRDAQDPLSEALGLDSEQDFFSEDSQIEAQEKTAACMKEAGFEYIPEDTGDFSESMEDYDSKEWAEEWGFGISTQRFSQDAVGPGLKGYDDSEFGDAGETSSPNQKIVEALSPEDQKAYEEALYGSAFSDEIEDGGDFEEEIEEEIDFDDLGCINAGFTEDNTFEFFEEFEDQLEELGTRLEADSRIAQAEQDLSKCVNDKGHEFNGEEKYYETQYEELEKIFPYQEPTFDESELPPVDPEDPESGDGEGGEGSAEEIFEDYEEPPLTDEQKTKLGEVQAEEIGTAVAAFECGLRDGEYADTIKEIENEYLTEFVEANKAGIEKYKK